MLGAPTAPGHFDPDPGAQPYEAWPLSAELGSLEHASINRLAAKTITRETLNSITVVPLGESFHRNPWPNLERVNRFELSTFSLGS